MRDIFVISADDVQGVALEKFGKKLTVDEIYQVKKMVEWGLDCWVEVVAIAIEECLKSTKNK